MAKIFSPPKGFTPPEIRGGQDIRQYIKDCDDYAEHLVKWAKENGDGSSESGEIIAFPVADGKARYVVVSMKPVSLIHIDTGDAYQFRYVNRLTAKDVREEVRRTRSFAKLFKGAR